jgi:hypothetical protein
MRLIFYPTSGVRPPIEPAVPQRPWMDASPEQFAYRCLPLNIANSHGWNLLCPTGFWACWHGGPLSTDVEIRADDQVWPPVAHFGSGTITFHIGYLVRTEANYDLWVGGPVNQPKDGIISLTGVVETDWSPYSFTMNWRFTRPNHWVRFDKGDPFCTLFPIERGTLERVQPEIRELSDNPVLADAYATWNKDRSAFLRDLDVADSEARRQKWQKDYFRGLGVDGQRAIDTHRTKLGLAEIKDLTGAPKSSG